MDDHDTPTPDELEQLALSLAMEGSLGRTDAQRVAGVLREVAARRRHPTSGRRGSDATFAAESRGQ